METRRKAGIWGSNGINPDVGRMLNWEPSALTVFADYISHNGVADYKRTHPDTDIIIRFQHLQNWHENVTESAAEQARRVLDKWQDIKALNAYVYFANELNLHYENGDNNPANQWMYQTDSFYAKYAGWVTDVARRIKDAVPEMRLVCPPFAFGHGEDGAPTLDGDITESFAGYDYLEETIKTYFENIITGHYYWGNAGGSVHDWLYGDVSDWYAFRWRRVLAMFKRRYGIDAKLIIDEAGNFGAGDADFTDQVEYYTRETLKDPRVIALTYFLWNDPTGSPGNLSNSWLQNISNIDAHLTRMNELIVRVDEDGENPPEVIDMALFRSFDESKDVLDENLHFHAEDKDYRITGSVARIIPADVVEQHWGGANPPQAGQLYWRVKRAALIPEAQAANRQNINVSFFDEDGVPYTGARCWFAYPTERLYRDSWVGAFDNGGDKNGDAFTYPTGYGEIAQARNGFAPTMGSEEIGPYIVGGLGFPTEVIAGGGLAGNRHTEMIYAFQLTRWGETTPDPVPGPDPTPGPPATGGFWSALKRLICKTICGC